MKKEKQISTEKAIQEKMNYYKSLLAKAGASLDDKIKTLNIVMKDLDKNSIDYQACEKLLLELEQEAAFEG
ncbi:MAG TPA: hypothetical protein VKU36_04345 [Candidatus Babeliales bacterium]|jgi:hypothetical protein|nr:hypothetical protein [Candidatus Babeliales bacterium]